jgi:redox-sensitive bicupin YhaK (pirin superfamily)
VVIAEGEGRALLLAGAPIGEPIARRGPFVMNTEAELDQAVRDYRSGRLVGG